MLSKFENHGMYIFESQDNQMRRFPDDLQIESIRRFKDLKIFYRVPFQIYRDNPYWVAPFWHEMKDFFKKENPFWSHAECQLFIAKKNNEVIGRIATIIDSKYCEVVKEKIGYFGFFECIQDSNCANALFQTAHDWLLSKQMNVMRGPIDGRIDIGCGFLYMGYNQRPCVLSTYSPEYYVMFAEKFGMKKVRQQSYYYIDLTKPLPKQLEEKAQQCLSSGVTIRPFNRLHTRKELNWWISLFLETFSDHWGYVPVAEEEVRKRFGVKQLQWFVDSQLFLVAEIAGEPIAYIWSTPDYNQVFQKMNGRLRLYELMLFLFTKQRINVGKLHFIGIKKEFRNHNIGSLLNYTALLEMKNRGYIGAEAGWIDEENTIAHTTIGITGATVYKTHRVFEKKLTQN